MRAGATVRDGAYTTVRVESGATLPVNAIAGVDVVESANGVVNAAIVWLFGVDHWYKADVFECLCVYMCVCY